MRYFITTIVTLVLIGCGGGAINLEKESVSNSTMAEKDLLTPAEQGGYGFEKIADDLGFTTYEWSEKR